MLDNDGEAADGKGYEVGYRRPPKHTRFPKGQSGNPNGRRKGSRALKTDLDEALKATLTITVAGKKRRGTTQALTMYALAIKSATGDLRAARLLADLVLTVFGPGDRGGAEAKLSKQDEELLERLLDRFDSDRSEQDVERTPSPAGDAAGDLPAPEAEDSDDV